MEGYLDAFREMAMAQRFVEVGLVVGNPWRCGMFASVLQCFPCGSTNRIARGPFLNNIRHHLGFQDAPNDTDGTTKISSLEIATGPFGLLLGASYIGGLVLAWYLDTGRSLLVGLFSFCLGLAMVSLDGQCHLFGVRRGEPMRGSLVTQKGYHAGASLHKPRPKFVIRSGFSQLLAYHLVLLGSLGRIQCPLCVDLPSSWCNWAPTFGRLCQRDLPARC